MPPPQFGGPHGKQGMIKRHKKNHWINELIRLDRLINFNTMNESQIKQVAKTLITWAALGIFTHFSILLAVLTGVCLCSVKRVQRSIKVKNSLKADSSNNQQPPAMMNSQEIPKGYAINY